MWQWIGNALQEVFLQGGRVRSYRITEHNLQKGDEAGSTALTNSGIVVNWFGWQFFIVSMKNLRESDL